MFLPLWHIANYLLMYNIVKVFSNSPLELNTLLFSFTAHDTFYSLQGWPWAAEQEAVSSVLKSYNNDYLESLLRNE